MADIPDAQILQALRDKAKLYAKLASDFERALNGGVSAINLAPVAKISPGLDAIRNYLSEKHGRPADVAKYFGCSVADVLKTIELPDSGIRAIGRGWLKLEDGHLNGHKH